MVDNKNIECVPVLDASNIIQDNHRPQVPANRSLADYELVSTSGCSGYIVAHAVNLDKHLTGRGNDFLRGTVRIFHPEFGVSTLHTSLSTVTWPQIWQSMDQPKAQPNEEFKVWLRLDVSLGS
ncbi:predicted protein [Histoplasma capsulatum var. duboisii H88]|uniref:Predicted protein n=1 Tax=Ajellomyces capsulatus (strain H88) TaxID=544711 RepID=F0UJE8_AJEC8|nr:predicted protein [Histoplasma capsulatum var. duboisii H88]